MKKLIFLFAILAVSCSPRISEAVAEDKIYSLPDNVYESIALTCGDGASNLELLKEYNDNKAMYDGLAYSQVIINK